LDTIVQKIIGIVQGTEKIPLVMERDEVYYVEEDEELELFMLKDTSPYIECILKNIHLDTTHIENIMNIFQ